MFKNGALNVLVEGRIVLVIQVNALRVLAVLVL